MASDDEEDLGPPERSYQYLADATARLAAEIDAALSADRWTIINNGSDNAVHRLYDAAALRHTTGLLRSISHNAQHEDEFAVRALGRSHTEAWLTGTYLHFGGPDVLKRIVGDTLDATTTTHNALQRYDNELAEAKKKTRKKLKAIRKANEGITLGNTRNPNRPPEPLHKEPHVPQQAEAGIDLSTRISNFQGVPAQNLSLSEITEALTKLGPERGFAYENFTHIYLHYRLASATSVHPTLHIYDSYFEPPSGYLVHTASGQGGTGRCRPRPARPAPAIRGRPARPAARAEGQPVRRVRYRGAVEKARPAGHRARRDHREHPPGSARHPGPRPGRLPRHQPRIQHRRPNPDGPSDQHP